MTATVRGADVSITAEVEAFGGVYRSGGARRDLFELLAEAGVNTARLRLWVDPRSERGEPYMGGTNDVETTAALARRARDAGLAVLLDLHYSDFWADPKKQTVPKAWRGLTGKDLEAKVADHTAAVVDRLERDGGPPEMVQVGNEITNGMLWPEGRTPDYDAQAREFGPDDEAAWDRLAGLLRAGLAAVPDSVRTILHLDFGSAGELYRGWFDRITARGVDDFDVIGLSYYPFWHGALGDLAANMNDVSARYDKDVLVVETSYAWTSEQPDGHASVFRPEMAATGGYPATVDGQSAFLRDLYRAVADVPAGRGLGVVYWEPGWLPVPGTTWASPSGMAYADDAGEGGCPWANQALFDFDGNALPSLAVLGDRGQ